MKCVLRATKSTDVIQKYNYTYKLTDISWDPNVSWVYKNDFDIIFQSWNLWFIMGYNTFSQIGKTWCGIQSPSSSPQEIQSNHPQILENSEN